MTFLLDTNVVSELRKARSAKSHPLVTAWAAHVPVGSLYLSAITLLELEMGVLHLERRDAMIAATALVHGMTAVTRNVADLEASGVQLLDPRLAQPASRR